MNTHPRTRTSGFTVIELIVVITILLVAGFLFYYQKSSLQTASQDERRKTAINAIHYSLEEVYYPKNGYYPAELSEKVLPAVDPALLTDANGTKIDAKFDASDLDEETKSALGVEDNTRLSMYVYEPTNCDNEGHCKSYTLRVQLLNEAEYVKKSKRK